MRLPEMWFMFIWKSTDTSLWKKWTAEQNKLYPKTKFWVEYRENKEGVVKNVEEVVFIKIEKDDSQYNDYLMVE